MGKYAPIAAGLALAGTLAASPVEAGGVPGVRVVAVVPGQQAAAAGLAAGDRLTHREAAGDVRPLNSPLGVFVAQHTVGQGAPVTLVGTRGGHEQRWRMDSGDWGLETAAADDLAGPSVAAWQAVVDLESLAGSDVPETVTAQVPIRLAAISMLGDRGLDRDESRAARLLAAQALARSSHYDLAAGVLASLLAEFQALPGSESLAGLALVELAHIETERGRFDAAAGALREAARRIAPQASAGTIAAAAANARGDLARAQGDLAAAEAGYREARDIYNTFGPTQAGATGPLRNLGTIAAIRGRLDEAENHYRSALDIAVLAGDDVAAAKTLNNLGIVAVRRGDLASAETYYQQALTINERRGAARSLNINLFNLADIAYARGDYRTGIALLRRALANFQRQAPEGLRVAQTRATLAGMLLDDGQVDEALELYGQAMADYERLAPESVDAALAIIGFGDAARLRGDYEVAQARFTDVLERRRAVAPISVGVAEARQYLARVELDRGDDPAAETHLVQARRIYEQVAPGSVAHAQTLHALAGVSDRRGDTAATLAAYEQAAAAIEAQTRRLGGADDTRSLFGDRYSIIFKDYIQRLLDAGRPAEAFGVLERYRARSLLALLAERDLGLDKALPDDLAADRRRLARAYDEAQDTLLELAESNAPATELDQVRRRLTEIKAQRDALAARLRGANGQLADLERPQPASVADLQSDLEPGTVVLSYSVGSERSALLVVSRERFDVVPLAIGDADLREQVRRFRFLIESGRGDRTPGDALLTAGATLYDWLVRPTETVTEVTRYLIVPDGPLHALPFSALVRRDAAGEEWQYLVERVPVHKTLSLTFHARQAAGTPPEPSEAGAVDVVLFADPAIEGEGDTGTNAPGREPLPYSREEVAGIAELFGERSLVFAGAEATERAARSAAGQARYLHFATHSVVDEVMPLDSALVLSPGTGTENGLLQAWEIFEDVTTPARLVVLSSCDSALGRETAGDGLIGLTRAFHYAGARSVAGTQWAVADRSTAVLMRAFYERLADGAAIDEALRDAQLSLLRGEGGAKATGWLQRVAGALAGTPGLYRHPYHWAAFELSGAR